MNFYFLLINVLNLNFILFFVRVRERMEKKFNKKEGEGRDLMIIHVDVDVCKKVESWEKVMVNKTHDS